MKKNLYILFLFLVFNKAYAQNTGSIGGQILDHLGQELPGINISLVNTSLQTATNSSGNFILKNIPDGSYTLQASGVGLSAQKQNLIVSGKPVIVLLRLNPSDNTLQEVLISTGRSVTNSSSSLTRTNTLIRDLPQSVQVVERNTIEEQQLFTVDQALRNVAGVNMSASGSISMRGFETNANQFLTNGMKGSPYPEGVIPLLGNIERIEVLHGASAILYGQGALGGTVNLVTKQPKKQSVVNASVSGGTFDLYRAKGDLTGSINKSKSLYFLAGAAYQNGGRFTKNFDNENLQLYGSLKWELGPKTSWQINGNYTRDRSTSNWQPTIPVYSDDPRLFSLPENFTTDREDSGYKGNSYQLQSVFTHDFNSNWTGNLLFGYSRSSADIKQYGVWSIDPQTNEVGGSFTRQKLTSPTTTINPYMNGTFYVGKIKNKIATGIDVTLRRSKYPNGIQQYAATSLNVLRPDYAPFNYSDAEVWLDTRNELFTYNTVAGYLQDQIEFTSKLKALIGLRYNNYFMRYLAINDSDGSALYDEKPSRTESFTPRAGIVFQPVESTSLYFDYNRGFIPQYSNERRFGGPFDPETSHQFEAGIKGDYLKNRLHPTLSIYQIDKKNVLTYYEDESLPDGYGYLPLQQVRSKGIELGLTGNITDNLFIIANYSHNDTRITKSNEPTDLGTTFRNVPYHLANGWLSYNATKSALKGLNLGFGVNYVGQRKASYGSLPSYTTLDAVIGYKYKNYGIQVNGNNLGGKVYAVSGNYSDYAPGMPRNFLVTLSASFK
ncbi:TonB-dependent receptor [Dyadobacter sp. 32]|uniref:TonB-dependent siderophore receptor n=1 Tax=Dyadobacter sp. 32 TaxID=538966 RepID=UPI0011EDCEB3